MVWIKESGKDGDGIQEGEMTGFGGQMNKRLGEGDWGESCHTLRDVPGLIFLSVWGEGMHMHTCVEATGQPQVTIFRCSLSF